jgi:hypothetical protein
MHDTAAQFVVQLHPHRVVAEEGEPRSVKRSLSRRSAHAKSPPKNLTFHAMPSGLHQECKYGRSRKTSPFALHGTPQSLMGRGTNMPITAVPANSHLSR